MTGERLGSHYAEPLTIDLCRDCRVLWLDALESAALSPGAVIVLFREIEAIRGTARPLAGRLGCPRCRRTLVLTHDVHRSGRIVYHRCSAGHGRLTTFHQFLREKRFIREITPAEAARLRVRVEQVACSNCGAPIDLSKATACAYCSSPIAMLDADAVRRTLAELDDAEAARTAAPDLDKVVDVLLEQNRIASRRGWVERGLAGSGATSLAGSVMAGTEDAGFAGAAADLLVAGVRALLHGDD